MQLNSGFHKLLKYGLGLLAFLKENTFCNLQNDILMRYGKTVQLVQKEFYKIIIIDLIATEINGNRTQFLSFLSPSCQLSNHLLNSNLSQLCNESVLLCHRNKLIRIAGIIVNSHQRLKAHNFLSFAVYLRLINHVERIFLNGLLHLL